VVSYQLSVVSWLVSGWWLVVGWFQVVSGLLLVASYQWSAISWLVLFLFYCEGFEADGGYSVGEVAGGAVMEWEFFVMGTQ